MKIIVGLGNPDRQYAKTRHNVGFRVVDKLADRWEINVGRRQFHGWTASGRIRERPVLLLKPATYMNRSGLAVREVVIFHKSDLADLLVIADDMALPLGRVRLRGRGSAGGHNGLSDIIRELGQDVFARLRVGIGQVSGERMVSHVLSPFTPEEEQVVGLAVGRATDAAECWVTDGVEAAMNQYNRAEDDGA